MEEKQDSREEQQSVRETEDGQKEKIMEERVLGDQALIEEEEGNNLAFPEQQEKTKVLPNPKKKGIFELIYGILFDPLHTMREVAINPPWVKGIILYVLISLLSCLVTYVMSSSSWHMQINATDMQVLSTIVGPFFMITFLLIMLISWFMYSGLLHLLADFFGGRGRGIGVLTVLALSSLPMLIFMPLNLILFLLTPESMANIFSFLFSLGASVWGAILLCLGIREVHQLTTGRAVLVVLLPPLGMLVIGILLFIFFIGALIPLVMSMEQMYL